MSSPTCGQRCRLISCLSLRQTLHILPSALHKWDTAERSQGHLYKLSPAILIKWAQCDTKEEISTEMDGRWQRLWGDKTDSEGNQKQPEEQRQKQRKGEGRRIKRNKSVQKESGRKSECAVGDAMHMNHQLNRLRIWQMMTCSKGDTGWRIQRIRKTTK